MDSIAPNLFVKNLPASLAFYERLGFKISMSVPENGDYVWVMLACGNATLMLQTMDSLQEELPAISRNGGGSLLLYVTISNIRQFYTSIESHVTILKGLEKTFYGATEFSVIDPDGFVLTFAEHEEVVV